MDELQLLEVIQMKTLTDRATGKKALFSVPITQHVTADQQAALKDAKKIALKCTKLTGETVLATIEEPVFFANRKEEISTRVFGTNSVNHAYI